MHHRKDHDAGWLHLVDDAVRPLEELANVLLPRLGHEPAGFGEACRLCGALQDAVAPSLGVNRRGASNVVDNCKHMLTSALKRVDKAVLDLTTLAHDGKLKTGRDLVFNLKNGGQGVGKISQRVPKAFITKMNKIKAQIISGKIKPPSKL